jgi:hypothetical protein
MLGFEADVARAQLRTPLSANVAHHYSPSSRFLCCWNSAWPMQVLRISLFHCNSKTARGDLANPVATCDK